MVARSILCKVSEHLGDSIRVEEDEQVVILDASALRERIEALVREAALGNEPNRYAAQWLVRTCALQLGIIPASIHELYVARGRGEVRDDFTVPAINLRAIPFYAAKSVFRAAEKSRARAFIFEIARSEIGYTFQTPGEYAASILGAAIAEGYEGPVFLQGDHFQISPKRYAADPLAELEAIRKLSKDSIRAGLFNIDIDSSTLVNLDFAEISDQQQLNFTLSAELSAYIRGLEPDQITTSLGGEIGEVGGHNSTEPELRAFMEGYNKMLDRGDEQITGLSKISIQTGTSHGGVVLPDGSIAEASVDFETLAQLSRVAKEYGMGGAVQHGASTLPESAFSEFPKAGALEIHLATNFQNILFGFLTDELRDKMYAYLRKHHREERKPDQTDEQFYYKTRKRAIGPFKEPLWNLPKALRVKVEEAWEGQFRRLFGYLNLANTHVEIEEYIKLTPIHEPLSSYLDGSAPEEDISDLAD
jgi:fructose/tagatose bisphosphate aldolase